ncbi:Uncharacterised protein [Acinetobacter baumannii]|nr:Uncharacterised protein [Acinetobacter baumannii]
MALQTQAIHRMDIEFQMDVEHDHGRVLFALQAHQRTQMQLSRYLFGKHVTQALLHQNQAHLKLKLVGFVVDAQV